MRRGTDRIRFGGRPLRLFLYYNAVLDCLRLMRRADLDDTARIEISLAILTDGCRWVQRLSPVKKSELYARIFAQEIHRAARSGGAEGVKTVDFIADEPLIYAAFYQSYGMDLNRCRNRLLWRDFLALFQGLNGTRLNEVMQIRSTELPEPNRYNQKEIQNLIRLKRYWALPLESIPDNYDDQLEKMFTTLKKMAKGGQ